VSVLAPGDVSGSTIDAVRAALSDPRGVVPGDPSIIAKATTQGISTTTGLVGINLEAPAKNLFPVLSPIRNWLARKPSARGATAVQWRAITGINTTNVKIGVAERSRNTVVTTKEVDYSQTYKPFGLDDFVTYDAQDAAVDFMDVRAEGAANLLAAVMVGEEKGILGGNVTAIGKPGTLTFADTGTGGSLSAATAYDVAVSALTSYGYLNGATGHASADAADETDGRTGSHTTAASGAGSTALVITWAAVRGAVAYNVFIGTSGGTKYYSQTVTVPKATVLAVVGSGNVPNTTDQTADALSFDGFIPQIEANGASQYASNGAYFKDLAAGTLTADGAGGIVEIDALLKSLWDNARIGPDLLYVNSQEAENIATKVALNGSTTTLRWTQSVDNEGNVIAGLVASGYRNRYTSPRLIPIEIHPYLAPGTILAISRRLPFPRNNVANPFELDVRREYTQYDWAPTLRSWDYGIYGAECLKMYFPLGTGSIVGIANG
jgi:hypothetical protein